MDDIELEFQRQINNLLDKNYPTLADISKEEFLKKVETLRKNLKKISSFRNNLETGHLSFVIVVKDNLVKTEDAMKEVEKGGKNGIVKLFPLKPSSFETIEGIDVPKEDLYLLCDIDRGKDTLNLTPKEALNAIGKSGRSPLTTEEGVAIITHFPQFLVKNNCFSLLASRNPKDKRVPAIWINAQKEPNLGWCWEGNPHTWLGSASCKFRLGPAGV